jgi:acyl-CoA synthetase (AMP-forming)/AMP-acid ligase II/acyl carrier protein
VILSDRTLPWLLQRQVAVQPNAPAIGAPDELPLTYAAVFTWTAGLLEALWAAGVAPRDRVAVVLPGGPKLALAFLGVAAGAACAPLNPNYRQEEFAFYLEDLAPKLMLTDRATCSAAIAAARALGIPVLDISAVGTSAVPRFVSTAPDPDDIALLLHTSGTTARPKLVPLTHANLYASAEHVRSALQLTSSDRCLNVMPLFHVHGLVAALLASLAAGGSIACAPAFLAPAFFSWMDACRPTWYTAVPTMHQAILARAEANRPVIERCPLRFIRTCSAAMAPQLMAALEAAFGAPVIEGYGMTEAAHQMASNPLPPGRRKPGSVGRAAGPEIAILGESGQLVAPGVCGEVVIRGPNVMGGYDRNPQANAAAFSGGWFRTGDQGYLDEDGYLFITGRVKELINRGGEKIAPREIEEVLLDHPAVAEAVAFSVPDRRLGEDVGAAVALRADATATERELREFVAGRAADFKVPSVVVFLEQLPKGPTGKVQRIGLAQRLGVGDSRREAPGSRAHTPPRSVLEASIAGIWAQVLGVPAFGVHEDFLDLGGDSVLAAQVVSRIRSTLGVELPQRSLFDAAKVAEQAAVVEELLRRVGGAPPPPTARAAFVEANDT